MDAELRTKVNKLLDFFTEPDQGDKYLKDLEDDLVSLIQQEIANQLKSLLDAHMIKPEYHNLVVGKWKELSDG